MRSGSGLPPDTLPQANWSTVPRFDIWTLWSSLGTAAHDRERLFEAGQGPPTEDCRYGRRSDCSPGLGRHERQTPTYSRGGNQHAKLMEAMLKFLVPGKKLDFERACKWALDETVRK
jgi:hypothetical protein